MEATDSGKTAIAERTGAEHTGRSATVYQSSAAHSPTPVFYNRTSAAGNKNSAAGSGKSAITYARTAGGNRMATNSSTLPASTFAIGAGHNLPFYAAITAKIPKINTN